MEPFLRMANVVGRRFGRRFTPGMGDHSRVLRKAPVFRRTPGDGRFPRPDSAPVAVSAIVAVVEQIGRNDTIEGQFRIISEAWKGLLYGK